MTARPYCGHCSRNARTVDTPRVRVRVEHCLILRDATGALRMIVRCHGATDDAEIPDTATETMIEQATYFNDGGTTTT